ncbi:sensor domain-containing protein [Clostridium chromiireducens]|uniref:Bifunctional diguanylate cyclase/phosphodiesterase n=1 Tax=Clostridium chromiireducens TaxID=225345 RepID=A0A1V4IVQ2_9CLOT|nr:bifunctional diguanylate cyclase/phosphodiesterase [Clostridium chromiireducens]OPJ63910.1 phytochrome-like protein cph2 [Clostridium chromiireducens]RII35719.1 bifunctional diguanylate cyclase/phosphodiesterase [Clostridium chromiireducens]
MKIKNNDLDYTEILEKYKKVVDEVSIAVWEWNIKEDKFFASNEWEKITECHFNNLFDFIGKIVIHEDRERAINDLNFFIEGKISFYRSQFRIITEKNQEKWIFFKGNMVKDENGEVISLFGVASDITEVKKTQKISSESVYYDSLTKLPNRVLFLMDIKDILDKTIKLNKEGAIIFIDLDNFKAINDTLGHDYGDLMLKVFSQLLSICVKDYGRVYRVGGDEFIVLIEKINSIENLKKFCDTLLNYCKKPFELNEKQIYVTASIGISLFPQDSADMNDLMRFADLAMFKSKEYGKNTYTFFEEALSKAYSRRILIEVELKESIKNEELFIVYQPQVDALENRIVAFEALLRWNSKKLGFVSPAEFIPIAEESGIIVDIGEWVLDKVCKKIREFKDKKYEFNNIAVNVSPIQIKETNFKDKIIKVCKENEIPLNLLEIEITESTLIKLNNQKIADLHELINKDINISIDDFGTGYSSLSYLTVLPINTLKIDKSFIDNIESEKNRAVIECILNLSKSLKYKVIAEGVELREQLQVLMNLGCNVIQGYYFSKPVCEDELEEMMKINKSISN